MCILAMVVKACAVMLSNADFVFNAITTKLGCVYFKIVIQNKLFEEYPMHMTGQTS